MKESTAWRRIAEEIDGGKYYWICHGLREHDWPLPETTAVQREKMGVRLQLFGSARCQHTHWRAMGEFWHIDEKGRNCRVLACLFLAAMTND